MSDDEDDRRVVQRRRRERRASGSSEQDDAVVVIEKTTHSMKSGDVGGSSSCFWIGSASLFVGFFASSLTLPFLQSQRDKLGCDALCFGTMQSARSTLSLLGSVLIGRLSDQFGRSTALYVGVVASLFSLAVSLYASSVLFMWIAMVPVALLNQNFSVMKALFADASHAHRLSDTDRAAAMGRLGMAAGLSFMLAPMLAATLLTTYDQAVSSAMVLTVASGVLMTQLSTPSAASAPAPSTATAATDPSNDGRPRAALTRYVMNLVSLPGVQLPGAQLLLAVRGGMSLAYHLFIVVWTPSLRDRFQFGARDHAWFMSWIGLWYAVSQGYVAKVLIRWVGVDGGTRLLQACVVCLSAGRVVALWTTSLSTVYVVMAAVIVALGVVNTILSSACARLASKEEIGGLFGVMEAVESLAGIVGPTVGGLLYRQHRQAPLAILVGVYAVVFVLVALLYRRHVVEHQPPASAASVADDKRD